MENVAESEIKNLSDGTSTVKQTNLNMIVFANEGMLKNYQETIDEFNNSQSDIRVTLENIYGEDWSAYEFALRSRVLSGKAPDIVDVSVVYRDAIIEDDLLLDLMPYVEKSGLDFDIYFDNQFEGLRKGDALYGIPSGALLMAVYVNKDLFREAGVELPSLDWSDSWTWDDFAEASKRIRALTSDEREIYGMTTAFSIGWILPFLMSNGADFLVNDNIECTATDASSIETFSFLKKLMFEDGVSPDMMKLVALQPYQYFFDGGVGIYVDGNWWMESIQSTVDFDWGVVPMPTAKVPATGMYVDSWAVTSASEHPEEAFELLKFFLEKEHQSSGIMKGIPVLKSAAREIYENRFPSLSPEEIDVWFDGIDYGTTPAYFYAWNEFQDQSTEILTHYSFGEFSAESLVEQLCNAYRYCRKEKE